MRGCEEMRVAMMKRSRQSGGPPSGGPGMRRLAGTATVIAVFGLMALVTRAQGPGGFGPGFGGPGTETKLVKDFDKNGDKRLDTAERAAARASIANGGGAPRRGWGRGGGFPGAGGGGVPTPGPKVTPADVR